MVAHNPSIVQKYTTEVVVFMKGRGKQIVRTNVAAEDMYESIDIVCGKLGRKLRKFKEKNGRER